jgi:prolyl oligopeptidase
VKYPPAPRTDLVDTLHGVLVPDPFRRLEDADDPETVAWVAAENDLCRRLLDSPERARVTARLRELHHVSRMSVPVVRGDRVFFTETDGTRGQAVLCLAREDGQAGGSHAFTPLVLVDPNLLDADATTAITVFEPDAAGERVAYGLSRNGSDLQQLLIHDVASGATLDDRLDWVKFASIAWHGEGFFYTRYPEPGTVPAGDEQYFCQVWHHRVGEPQSADRRVYHRPDAREVVFDVNVTSDERHLVIASYQGASDHAELHVMRLDGTGVSGEIRPLTTGFTSGWHFIDGREGRLYFRTDADAPFGRIVRFDLDDGRGEEGEARTVIAESRDTIVDAAVANGRLVVSVLRHASSRLTTWSLDGDNERVIALPEIGTINGLGAQWTNARSFAAFTSFTTPPAIMACDADLLVPIREGGRPFDPSRYVTEQVWYPSKDGTAISMFLVSRRADAGGPGGVDDTDAKGGEDASRNGRVLLTGYGGFNISLTPAFDPSDILWLEEGGTIAVANLRGGGEYGDAWHKAGMRERKQNVFDDFIAAAEWLTSNGRAARGSVAIEGGSNGGLLVGACLVQRPDLFGAAICRVPVADMLRYHLFTVGRFWIPEYGCADTAGDFPFLLRYSPYHNVVDGTAYPPTLVMTANTDDRVAPGMAKKFAARLQEAATGADSGPILLRVETRAGHGAGKPMQKQVEEQTDLHTFLSHYLTRTSVNEHTRR